MNNSCYAVSIYYTAYTDIGTQLKQKRKNTYKDSFKTVL